MLDLVLFSPEGRGAARDAAILVHPEQTRNGQAQGRV